MGQLKNVTRQLKSVRLDKLENDMRKLLFILLIPFTASAQQVVITGQIPDCPDSADVFVSKPIGTYFNALYKQSAGKVSGHQFRLVVPMDNPGFITVENKYLKSVVFVEPGDSVDIGISQEGSQGRKRYKGSNAAGQELFNNETPMSFDNLGSVMDRVLDTAKTPNGAIWGLRSTMTELKAPLLAHLRKGDITVAFYENIVATIESRLVYHMLNGAGNRLEKSEARKNKALSEKDLRQVIQDITDIYDPFDAKYLSGPEAARLVYRKCYLIKKGYLRGGVSMNEFWQHFDEASRLYAFAPISSQEMMAGNAILAHLPQHATEKNTQAETFSYFKENFPKSAYIPAVSDMLKRKP